MPPVRDSALPHVNRKFVGRIEQQRIFEDLVFNIPENRATLCVFYGAGGQGKTRLRREIARKIDPEHDRTFRFLRHAELDLSEKIKTDPDLLLVWIRNAFAKSGIFMPCFDLALASMWEGSRTEQPFPTLTNPWLARPISAARSSVDTGANKAEEWFRSDAAKELLGDAIGEIPALGFVLKKIGKWAIDKSKMKYLEHTRSYLEHLYRDGEIIPTHEISAILPWMLAQDLNYHIKHNNSERFSLFIDEYESIFDQGLSTLRRSENKFDSHLRHFVKETNGLLIVFFSRERLPWAESADWHDDLAGRQHLVGGLSAADAEDFLQAIPIADESIRRAIIESAREEPKSNDPVYPLMLDLQVEHWRNLSAKGDVRPECFAVSATTFEERRKEIIRRILRDYDESLQVTLEYLSVLRRFDKQDFEYVAKTFSTGITTDRFERISEMSFITKYSDGYLIMHKIIAQIIEILMPPERRDKAKSALFDHYEKRAKVESHLEISDEKISALFEASYLKLKIDKLGYTNWLFDATQPLERAARRAPFAELWREALDNSKMATGEGSFETGRCMNKLGLCYYHMRNNNEALFLLKSALLINKSIFGLDHIYTGYAYNNLALVYKEMGNELRAMSLFERALQISKIWHSDDHPEYIRTLKNFGLFLRDMGHTQRAEPILEEAFSKSSRICGPKDPLTNQCRIALAILLRINKQFDKSITMANEALIISKEINGEEHPDTCECMNNLGVAKFFSGEVAEAIEIYNRALSLSVLINGDDHPITKLIESNIADTNRIL